jgi:hypothetical protein
MTSLSFLCARCDFRFAFGLHVCLLLVGFRDGFFFSVCPQTLELKVPIHCEGCLKKVKKIVQKIDGKLLD